MGHEEGVIEEELDERLADTAELNRSATITTNFDPPVPIVVAGATEAELDGIAVARCIDSGRAVGNLLPRPFELGVSQHVGVEKAGITGEHFWSNPFKIA